MKVQIYSVLDSRDLGTIHNCRRSGNQSPGNWTGCCLVTLMSSSVETESGLLSHAWDRVEPPDRTL